jgi:chloramphenicol O-acetyltransferase
MKLILFYYVCRNCDCNFKSPQLPEYTYGEFLMRTKNGDLIYLDSLKDSTFDEMGKIFDEIKSRYNVTSLDESDIFQDIYSVACDKNQDGHTYIPITPQDANKGECRI